MPSQEWQAAAHAHAVSSSLPELPDQILLVNSPNSGACSSLCADAAKADVVGVDFEWAPDRWGSNNPISVMLLDCSLCSSSSSSLCLLMPGCECEGDPDSKA